MKRDTRQEIINAAKELFNEHGFNTVSTREIAAAVGISKGNLTYYFKKKEEIIEAILAEASGSEPGLQTPMTLEELDTFFLDIQQVVQENAFYFWHHAQLSQLSPTIRQQQNKIYQSNFNKLSQAFEILQAEGMIMHEEYACEYDRHIDALLLSSIYWMPFQSLKQGSGPQSSFRDHAWSVLYRLLTEKGRICVREITGK